jgi:hypothetical protein
MKSNSNPYSSPESIDGSIRSASSESKIRNVRWLFYFAIAIGVAAIPVYGFYTHAARDSQTTVLWMMLAWLISLVNALVSGVLGVIRFKTHGFYALLWIGVSAILVVMLFLGFYGIGQAVVELWAG